MTTALVDYKKTIALALARSSIIFDNQRGLGHYLSRKLKKLGWLV